MAYTAVTSFSTTDICLNPGDMRARCVMGTLGENASPGQVVVKNASTGLWMLADTDDSSYAGPSFQQIGIVGYRQRINPSTYAEKAITDAWVYNSAGDLKVPIWTSGICICYINDLNKDYPQGGYLAISSTAGSLGAWSTEDTTHTDTGVAVIRPGCATAAIRIKDNDTKTIVAIGECMGMHWGGWNTS